MLCLIFFLGLSEMDFSAETVIYLNIFLTSKVIVIFISHILNIVYRVSRKIKQKMKGGTSIKDVILP